MSKDRSKPNGVHSRCKACKREAKPRLPAPPTVVVLPPPPAPAAPPPLDDGALQRRAAILELIKRHRLEFDDIMWTNRSRTTKGKKKSWINLATTSI